MIVLVAVSLLVMLSIPAYGEEPSRELLMNASYHRAQAATYRQQAAQFDQAIHRYEIMARVYPYGSERSVGTVNPQGRRAMVERTKRAITYFQQKNTQPNSTRRITRRSRSHYLLSYLTDLHALSLLEMGRWDGDAGQKLGLVRTVDSRAVGVRNPTATSCGQSSRSADEPTPRNPSSACAGFRDASPH